MKLSTLLFLAGLLLPLQQVAAQMVPGASAQPESSLIELDDPASKEAVRDMVSRLSDDSVRALLIQRLDAVAEANERKLTEGEGAFSILQRGFGQWFQHARGAMLNPVQVPVGLASLFRYAGESLSPRGIGSILMAVVFAIIGGLIAERLVSWFFRRRKQALIDARSTTLWGILKILYTRLSFDVLGVAAFAIVGSVVLGNQLVADSPSQLLGNVFIATIVGAWIAYVLCRFYFAPRRPDLRICLTTDGRATRLTVSYSLLAGYIVLVHNVYELMLGIGVDSLGGWESMGPLGFFLNISMYTAAIGVIWFNADALQEILHANKARVYKAMGEEAEVTTSWFSRNWPMIAMLLLALKYTLVEMVINLTDVAVYSKAAVFITFFVIFFWPSIDANVSLFVSKGISAADDETDAAARARRRMQQGLLRVGRVLVVCAVMYLLAALWGVNILSLAEAGLGARFAGHLIELVLIALFAYVVWELLTVFVERWLANEGGGTDDHGEEPGGGDAGGVGLSRIATLLPIMRGTGRFVIIAVSIIMVLNNWGVNIGPLIAGAGVVGLAIGFGAQTLVKDIVSGLFFLADDAFRVGEYIDVGGTMGNVEKISLRSLRLRHHRGLVHTIPYGEIPKLTNFSRDWVIMKLRFRVPFDTDVNKIKKIFKGIGKDLLAHEELGDDFLQPFKSQGVAEVDESGIVVRGKFMAKPGKQFMIRKELYVRVQKAFEEAGIPFARKQVMVHVSGLDKGQELDDDAIRSVAGAAAEEATAEDELPANPKPA